MIYVISFAYSLINYWKSEATCVAELLDLVTQQVRVFLSGSLLMVTADAVLVIIGSWEPKYICLVSEE